MGQMGNKIAKAGIFLTVFVFFAADCFARRVKSTDFRYIYGPVSSWRLGASLGIDPLSQDKKICSFDCLYCQTGKTDMLTLERKVFVKSGEILKELGTALKQVENLDYITLAGRGEPTLAANLGEIIRGIKEITDIPVAVLTNASLINDPQVQGDLLEADFVMLKMDAFDNYSMQLVNKAHLDLEFSDIIAGIRDFRTKYQGKAGIQNMFVKENKSYAGAIARVVATLGLKAGDEIQLNTPLRPRVSELSSEEMLEIKKIFEQELVSITGLRITMVYEAEPVEVSPISERQMLQKRGSPK